MHEQENKMSKSIYSKSGSRQHGRLAQIVASLENHTKMSGSHNFVDNKLAGQALSMESLDSVATQTLSRSIDTVHQAVESIRSSMESMFEPTNAQMTAAAAAAVIGSNPVAFLRRKESIPQSTEGNAFIASLESEDRIQASLEAYDEKENRQAAVYTVAYNMQAARQDEFGEAFFPTVVVTPDQIGFRISIDLVTVIDDLRRQVSGALDNFNRRNIIYAQRDASILKNDLTALVPVHRVASSANFVDTSLLATRTVNVGGENITTSALAFNKKFSLLGLSQSDALVAAGLQDSTDAVDPAVTLDSLYLKVHGVVASVPTDEVIRLDTHGLPRATFNYSVQGAARQMTLNFETNSLRIGKATKQADGSASVLLAPLVSAEYSVRLSVTVNGSVDLQTSTTGLMVSEISVVSITTSAGVKYGADDAAVAAIKALFNNAVMVGYDLGARRTNSNRRQRGQLLDTITYNQTYSVPLLSPVTVPRPLGQGDQTDPTDLAALITATRIRTSNAAVTELQRTAGILKQLVNDKDNAFDTVEVLGTGRHLVTPVYAEDDLDFSTAIDSIASHKRAADIQAVLVNKIRDIAYNAYRDSGYKAAADALNGGNAPVPTVIIGTDPVLARYIQVEGDLRTLGGEFNVKIVSTLDTRVSGKIYVAFGDFNGASEGTPNPLHFGNMGWKPEVTLVLPLHRNGGNSKELVVQPSFLHVTNCPILGLINVTNLPEVVASKVAIWNDPQ